jgi:hypothetical protein
MWRGGLGAAYLLPALSSADASIASPCFRFHIPLIEPDVRISRFRLSEKGSRGRPREVARPLGKADEAQHFWQGVLRKPLGFPLVGYVIMPEDVHLLLGETKESTPYRFAAAQAANRAEAAEEANWQLHKTVALPL